MTLFGKRTFAGVMKHRILRRDYPGLSGWALNAIVLCPKKKTGRSFDTSEKWRRQTGERCGQSRDPQTRGEAGTIAPWSPEGAWPLLHQTEGWFSRNEREPFLSFLATRFLGTDSSSPGGTGAARERGRPPGGEGNMLGADHTGRLCLHLLRSEGGLRRYLLEGRLPRGRDLSFLPRPLLRVRA